MKINSIDSSNERLVDNGKDFFRSKIDDIGNKNTVGGEEKNIQPESREWIFARVRTLEEVFDRFELARASDNRERDSKGLLVDPGLESKGSANQRFN